MSLTRRQLALRRDKIGASEVAALAGLSKWASPIQIYEAKVEGVAKETTLQMELGHLLEEPVATLYARRTRTWLRVAHSLASEEFPMALATPDRAVFQSRVSELAASKKLGLAQFRQAERGLECKTTNWRERGRWGEEGSDQVPDEYAIQCIWGMGVSGVRRWDLAVLVDHDEFLTYSIPFDEELFRGLYEIAARFMVDHVLPHRPPPVDATEHYAEFLGRAWPTNSQDLVAAELEMEVLAVELAKLAEVEKRVELAKRIRQNAIKARIGEAGGMSGGFGKIYWRRNKPKRTLDAKAALGELTTLAKLIINVLPDGELKTKSAAQVEHIIEAHTREEPGARVFRPYWAPQLKEQIGSLGETLAQLERQTAVVDEQDRTADGIGAAEQTGEVQPQGDAP